MDYATQSAPGEYVVGHALLLSDKGVIGRWTNALLEIPPDSLPGVLSGHPNESVNGSLWTLAIEITAYALVALGGLVILFWRRWALRAA